MLKRYKQQEQQRLGGTLAVTGATTLTTDLTVPNGGTGVSTFTDKGILYGQGASAVLVTAAGTENQLLQAGSSGIPAFQTVTGLNPAGSIMMYAAAVCTHRLFIM